MCSYTSKSEGGGNLQGSRREKRVAGDEPPTLSPCLHYLQIYQQSNQHLTAPWLFCFSNFLLICSKWPSLLTDLQHTTTILSRHYTFYLSNCNLISSADFPYCLLLIPLLISLFFSYCPVLLFKISCLHLHLSLSLFLKAVSPKILLPM